jgi:hypothetical protein
MELAVDDFNFDEQLAVIDGFQEIVLEQAERLRYTLNYLGQDENESLRLRQLEQQYRAYTERRIEILEKSFERERMLYEDRDANLTFRLSIIDHSQHSQREELINRQLQNRVALSKTLTNQMLQLQMTTDENIRSSETFKNALRSLEESYRQNVQSIRSLIQAQQNLVNEQLAQIRQMQNDIVDALRNRYQSEKNLAQDAHNDKMRMLDDEANRVRQKYDAEIKYINDMLCAQQRAWNAEDARNRRNNDIRDMRELERRRNSLLLAANTGDASAISMIQDIDRQIENLRNRHEDANERDRRNDWTNQANDQIEALRDRQQQELDALDKTRERLQAEHDIAMQVLDERLRNENLFKEARILLESQANDEILALRMEHLSEIGEKYGILGTQIINDLHMQVADAMKDIPIMEYLQNELLRLERELRAFGASDSLDIEASATIDIEEFENNLNILGVILRDNLDEINNMTDTELLEFVSTLFGEIPESAAIAIADTITELQNGVIDIEHALQAIGEIPLSTWFFGGEQTDEILESVHNIFDEIQECIESLTTAYDADAKNFNESQEDKLFFVRKVNDEIVISTGRAFENMGRHVQSFATGVSNLLQQIADSVNQLVASLGSVRPLNLSTPAISGAVGHFSTGGLNRGDGLRFLHDHEQVLTPQQSRDFSDLVFGLGSKGMQNISNTIQQAATIPTSNIQSRANVEANFTFNGNITSEALPQIQKMVHECEQRIFQKMPEYIARKQFDGMNRRGARF